MTRFRGRLKQLETSFAFPVMEELFDCCFSDFATLDAERAELQRQGLEQLVTAAGVELIFGYRPRRFSGPPPLPPGRYFTLCADDRFDDRGTLRDELTAYYSGESGLTSAIYDPLVDTSMFDLLRESGSIPDDAFAYPFYLLVYLVERETTTSARFLAEHPEYRIGEPISFTYGVREFEADIPDMIDLRYPETQEWFTRMFVDLELASKDEIAEETHVHFLDAKEPPRSFGELLPTLVSLETGGGMIFGQAIGHWLRSHGASGLVFPSARANAFNKVRDGSPVEWGGWNVVLYADAEEPEPARLFGRMSTWRDRDHDHIHVDYSEEGPERGSFSIRGTREFNVVNFDLEKQIACGAQERNTFASIVGARNEAISQTVNELLELERAERPLSYQDFDYVSLVSWLEDRWRDPPA